MNNTGDTDFTGENIGENEMKEEYQGPTEDGNISICLEEDSYDALETSSSLPEDLQGSIDAINDSINPPEDIVEEISREDSEEDKPIGLRTKPSRRSARVRVKSAKRKIENVFEDSEDDSEDYYDAEYTGTCRQPTSIEFYVDKPVTDEAKLDKILGEVDIENLDSKDVKRSGKYLPQNDDDYQPGFYEYQNHIMGIKKWQKKKKEKFLDPETGLGLSDPEDDPDKWYWKNGKRTGRKRLKLGIVCRGPGCKCGQKFGNKTKLNQHYIDIGCYSCKRCMIRFGCPYIYVRGSDREWRMNTLL